MWRILRADLRYRGVMLLVGLSAVAFTGLVLYFASVPGTPILHFIVITTLLTPALLNLIGTGIDDKEERICLHCQLPVTRLRVGFVRTITPVIVQLLGTAVAISISISGFQVHNSGAPSLQYILVIAAIVLTIGQLLSLQRQLTSICRGRKKFTAIVSSVAVISISAYLALLYLVFTFLFRFLSVGGGLFDPGQIEIPAMICALTNTAITLFLANLALFQKRDVGV